ncbi:predicted protein [Arabidopsis lyrata subsp. lyrata]|uniref:Predicted protein n=1 Tax=Arabidopsis lyrata subsp. lyrata TaxID=81972 RepID=D7MXQ4_ARALL|nr:predicted protein [Arabidopsis lyrata subsp. lyrata]
MNALGHGNVTSEPPTASAAMSSSTLLLPSLAISKPKLSQGSNYFLVVAVFLGSLVSLPIRPIPSSSLHIDQHLLDHQHWSWDMDQGLGMATYWKHDLSLLWPISQLTEQCGLHDLYQKNNRSSCLRLVVQCSS